jgi:hypothetical protein
MTGKLEWPESWNDRKEGMIGKTDHPEKQECPE